MNKYMVEYNFVDGKAMKIKMFDCKWKAQKFAEENSGVVYEFENIRRI